MNREEIRSQTLNDYLKLRMDRHRILINALAGEYDVNPTKTDERFPVDPNSPIRDFSAEWKPPLAAQIAQMELERKAALDLLGEIVATVTLPANRAFLVKVRQQLESQRDAVAMDVLLAEFDRWKRHYKQLTGGK